MTGMNPEQLRQTIARATLPLLGEYETLTTAQIARAAGIGEADLLAVFADDLLPANVPAAGLDSASARPGL